MSADKHEIKKELENLREDAKKIRDDISSLFDRLMEIGKNGSAFDDEVREEGRKLLEDLNQIIESTSTTSYSETQKKTSRYDQFTEDATEKFNTNPVMSLFVAFAAGVILGKWTSK